MKKNHCYTLLIISVVFLLNITSVLAENQVIVDFYYSTTCGPCGDAVVIINKVKAYYAENYSGIVIIQKKEIISSQTNYNEMIARGLTYPSVIINNETKITETNFTEDHLIDVIDRYIANLSVDKNSGDSIYFPFIGAVNLYWSCAIIIMILLIIGLSITYYHIKKKERN